MRKLLTLSLILTASLTSFSADATTPPPPAICPYLLTNTLEFFKRGFHPLSADYGRIADFLKPLAGSTPMRIVFSERLRGHDLAFNHTSEIVIDASRPDLGDRFDFNAQVRHDGRRVNSIPLYTRSLAFEPLTYARIRADGQRRVLTLQRVERAAQGRGWVFAKSAFLVESDGKLAAFRRRAVNLLNGQIVEDTSLISSDLDRVSRFFYPSSAPIVYTDADFGF